MQIPGAQKMMMMMMASLGVNVKQQTVEGGERAKTGDDSGLSLGMANDSFQVGYSPCYNLWGGGGEGLTRSTKLICGTLSTHGLNLGALIA